MDEVGLYDHAASTLYAQSVIDEISGEGFLSMTEARRILGRSCAVPRLLQPGVLRELDRLGRLEFVNRQTIKLYPPALHGLWLERMRGSRRLRV